MTRTFACAALCLALATGSTALAIEPRTEHTFRLGDGETAPDVPIEALGWLVGTWHGTAFGKRFEASWNPPSAGSMVGTFKLLDGDAVEFYELLVIDARDGALGIKVKHFDAAFSAWEDKDDFVHFKLVAVEDAAVHFSGISFYRRDADRFDAFIVMRSGEQVREERLTYQRSGPAR